MNKKNSSIKSKFIFFIIVLLIVGNIGLGIPSYYVAKGELEDKGRTILKNSVDIAIQLINQYAISVENGILSEEEAKEQVREFLVGQRNPDGTRMLSTPIDLGKNGYFLAYDDAGYEVMHPKLEGQNVLEVMSYGKSPIPVVREQLRVGKSGGFLEYEWDYPNGQGIGRKISYSQYEPNWGWTLVATAYTSDYNQAAEKIMQTMLVLFLLTVLLAFIFTNYYLQKLLEPIFLVIASMKKNRYHTIEKIKVYHRKDEFTQLAQGYNEMLDSLEYHLDEIKQREKELKRLAYLDELTRLANLNMITVYANRKMETHPQQGSLILIDLREFKMINSVYGMAFGDDMIRWIGKSLNRIKPDKNCLLARIGGNEFAIWMQSSNEEIIHQWIRSIEKFWREEYDEKRLDLKIRFTIAYVVNDEINEDFERILQKANIALQYAKVNDLTYVKYSAAIYNGLEHEAEIKKNAEKGLALNEFYPAYQEKVDAITQDVLGVEALARWESEAMGVVSPGVFIPIMNRSKLIRELTEKMVEAVFMDYHLLVAHYGKEIKVSLNISPIVFMNDDFTDFILTQGEKFAVPYSCIVLEITEDIFINNLEKVNQKIKALRRQGIKISLDDFGTGYSSLNYLRNIDLDEVKIDKSFIDDIVNNQVAHKMLFSIIDVIKNFGWETVAEGVETKEQLQIIREAGCKVVQGYYYSKPKRLEEYIKASK